MAACVASISLVVDTSRGRVFAEEFGRSRKLGEIIKRAKRDKMSKALDTTMGLIELEDVDSKFDNTERLNG